MKKLEQDDTSTFDKILKETPLDTRLYVSNSMMFMMLLTELGYREDRSWTDEEEPIFQKLHKLAREHTDHQMTQIAEYQKDFEVEIDISKLPPYTI